MSGVFLVSHKIFDSPGFKNEPFTEREAFLYLISEANKEEAGRRRYPRGACHVTTRQLTMKWQWAKSKVWRFLRKLERNKSATINGTRNGTLIGTLNYAKYQDTFRNVKHQTDRKPEHQPEQKCDTLKQPNNQKQPKQKKDTPKKVPYGPNGFCELTTEEYDKLKKKYNSRCDYGVAAFDAWVAKKNGQLRWFYKNYHSAFTYLNPKNCFLWEEADKLIAINAKEHGGGVGAHKKVSFHQQRLLNKLDL